MEYKISGYKPEKFFHFFEDFSAVPRGSGFEEGVSNFLVGFAKDRGLEVYQDEAYNVIIKKPGSKGAEDKPPVILQGHMDMVCEKVAGCTHDFHTEGIDMVIEDGWVTANGTTLGGDDGVADAFMMTVLDDDEMVHPPLECVFTTGEEVGLIGASQLDFSKLQGRTMINLDSEWEGILTVSCAGGMEYTMSKDIKKETVTGSILSFDLAGLLGGHSGSDIDLERTNGIKLAARAINVLLKDPEARVAELNGGNADNAIPRECKGAVWFPTKESADKAEATLKELADSFHNEITPLEPAFTCELSRKDDVEVAVLSREDGRALITAALLAPNGVRHRDPEMDNFVLTSLNLGVVRTEGDAAKLVFAPRSSVDSYQQETLDLLDLTAATFGFTTTITGAYPGWEKVEGSHLVEIFQESYHDLFHDELKVEGIHAGLECGLFYANLPGLDPVSIGPNMVGVHTPDEKLDLASTERFFQLIADVLKRLAS